MMAKIVLFGFLLLLQTVLPCDNDTKCCDRKAIGLELMDMLKNTHPNGTKIYNKLIPPGYPTPVNATFIIQSVMNVNELEGYIQTLVSLARVWTDDRLTFGVQIGCTNSDWLAVPDELVGEIWQPNFFIASASSSSFVNAPDRNNLVELRSDGLVKQVVTMNVQLPCVGHYQRYPFDWLDCKMDISGKLHDSIIKLGWLGDSAVVLPDSLSVTSFKILPDYDFNEVKYSGVHHTAPLTYVSPLESKEYRITIRLRRDADYYILVMYLPNMIFCIIAWLSLLYSPPPDTTRSSICLSCLITMMLQYVHVATYVPKTEYVKGVDIWMLVALLWITTMFLEYTVLHCLHRHYDTKGKIEAIKRPKSLRRNDETTNELITYKEYAAFIDTWFMAITGVLYIVFIIVYFVYTTHNDI